MLTMLYLLMDDPKTNRYAAVGAYKRDRNTGILLPISKFSRRLWTPDELRFGKARAIPTNVLINGNVVDNVLRYLSAASGDADGMMISPYDPAKSAAGKLSKDTEAIIADVESMLRAMRHDPSTQLSRLSSGAEMVRASYFTFREDAKGWLLEQEARIFMQ